MIAWAWDGGGGEGGGIKGALSSLWANITSFIGEKFNPANWFKEGSLLDGLFGAANKAADERDATEYGKSVGDKLAEGMSNSQKDVRESSVNLAKTVEDATRETAGINSPSTMMEENGYWLDMGLAQGMEGTAGMAAITAACGNISSTINSQFRDYWGIHSPSTVSQGDASNILAGMCIGFSQTDGVQNSLLALNGGIRSTLLGGMDTTKTDVTNKATDIVGALSGVFGGTTTTAENILKTLGGSGSTTTNPTTTGRTSSTKKTGKTLAEQIQARYKTRLEANKTLQSTIDQEYELWQAENQYSASEDDLMAKKAAHAADAIKAQTERVSIAQAKYDALYSKWGAEKAETKTAYNELLEEKTSLAELKAKQYTDLFEEVAKRYDTNLDTLEKQYNLWSTDNDRTATKRDKILKEREYQTEELTIREKKEANAKEQYDLHPTMLTLPLEYIRFADCPDEMTPGMEADIRLEVKPANTFYRQVNIVTRPEGIAEVTADGLVRGIKNGTAVIRAECGPLTAEKTIVVRRDRVFWDISADFAGCSVTNRLNKIQNGARYMNILAAPDGLDLEDISVSTSGGTAGGDHQRRQTHGIHPVRKRERGYFNHGDDGGNASLRGELEAGLCDGDYTYYLCKKRRYGDFQNGRGRRRISAGRGKDPDGRDGQDRPGSMGWIAEGICDTDRGRAGHDRSERAAVSCAE
ncbi:MAG: hypothetical protein MR651_10560 [Faecalibacterium sp.]|nr:hypothetical protein [Faecalibacterium sp.]